MPCEDGLPDPTLIGEFYLRALVDEVRGLRADISKLAPAPKSVVTTPLEDEPESEMVELQTVDRPTPIGEKKKKGK